MKDIEILRPAFPIGLPNRRRSQLTLSLDMPKRCKFAIPYTAPVIKRPTLPLLKIRHQTRTITVDDLAAKLKSNSPGILLLDCRPFLSYNMDHIRGAANIRCADRLHRKRLRQGKTDIVDLIHCKDTREIVRVGNTKEIIVYDEHSWDIATLPPDSAVSVALRELTKDGRNQQQYFVAGGMSEFRRHHKYLCDTSVTIQDHRPLYSPTTPVTEPEVETAIASRVLPFLYIGNERDAANLQRLEELNITYVLNVTSHIPAYFEDAGIVYKRLAASDSGEQNLKQYFNDAISFIDEAQQARGTVLIHCQAGVSRSATITIAYLLQHSRLSMLEAYKFVKTKRPIISPNFNFMGQLLEFEQDLNAGVIKRNLSVQIDSSHTNDVTHDQSSLCIDLGQANDVTDDHSSFQGHANDVNFHSEQPHLDLGHGTGSIEFHSKLHGVQRNDFYLSDDHKLNEEIITLNIPTSLDPKTASPMGTAVS